ncbi:nitroreductase/quinone reductase family protein [Nocardia sp. NPDC127526]|uniref:nitroreductase/quinone reductase family protein n=1 Tax=Nocardia sp. NPDC127526 TaxID=3345393 RepID=UPI00362985E8
MIAEVHRRRFACAPGQSGQQFPHDPRIPAHTVEQLTTGPQLLAHRPPLLDHRTQSLESGHRSHGNLLIEGKRQSDTHRIANPGYTAARTRPAAPSYGFRGDGPASSLAGPMDGTTMTLIAVHGRRADWVRNIEAQPRVRLRRGWRWHDGVATVTDATPEELQRFNAYARNAPRIFGMAGEPLALVRINLVPRT